MVISGLELRDAMLGSVIESPARVRYHLREVIGEGGQGWVYKANYGEPDGFWVVVKVLRPECVHSEALRRFEREAEVLRRLASVPSPNPHIVRFYDYGVFATGVRDQSIELPFIALEHVDGQTLASVIRSHGGFGLPIARVRRLMRQVARALHAVHEQRIVHRDLKPSNILLTHHDGQEIAKVTDFGLVKLPDLSTNKTISVAGASLGYAPPEQFEMGNTRVSAQTDVFSFASVLFEVLCGTEAFPLKHGDTPIRVVARMLTGDRPSLTRVHATVPRELRDRAELCAALDREIGRALSADPAVRHGSIREFWEQVEPLLDEAGSRTHLDESATFAPIVNTAPRITVNVPNPDWRMTGQPLAGERLRAAVIAADRHSIVAVGLHGLYRFARGVWAAMQLPSGVDARYVRGVRRGPRGELLIYGDGGFAMTITRSGGAERLPIVDRDLVLLGAHADEHGILFCGERLSRPVGVLVDLPSAGPAEIRSIDGTPRLHGVTRLAGGAIVLCGAQGALFEVSGGEVRPIRWGRTGHLYATTAAPDGGAYAVGSGGHALRISPPAALPGLSAPPTATLEAVQTTRDLTGVVLDEDGLAWAVGGQARLLQRRQATWTRVPLDPAAEGRLVAVRPCRDGITVLVENGAVLEGPGTHETPPPAAVSTRGRPD
ncbi:Serine/threonine protein kinase [Minicystis rosea]|nr:Serine/threonine protein kinase [Minicystis rosea]